MSNKHRSTIISRGQISSSEQTSNDPLHELMQDIEGGKLNDELGVEETKMASRPSFYNRKRLTVREASLQGLSLIVHDHTAIDQA